MTKRCTRAQLTRGAVFWHVDELTGVVGKYRVMEPFGAVYFLSRPCMTMQEIEGSVVNPTFSKRTRRHVFGVINAFTTSRRAHAYARVVKGRRALRKPFCDEDDDLTLRTCGHSVSWPSVHSLSSQFGDLL